MSKEIPQKQGKVGYKNPPTETRFKPGQSGNPGGLPKGTPKMSVAYMKLLALSPDELKSFKPKNVAEEIALKQVRAACKSSKALASVKEITDRTEGKVPQRVEVKEDNVDAYEEAFRIFCELSAHLGLSEEELRAQFDAMKAAEERRVM